MDQHIAHERVLYERFREAAENKKVEVQDLLFPSDGGISSGGGPSFVRASGIAQGIGDAFGTFW